MSFFKKKSHAKVKALKERGLKSSVRIRIRAFSGMPLDRRGRMKPLPYAKRQKKMSHTDTPDTITHLTSILKIECERGSINWNCPMA